MGVEINVNGEQEKTASEKELEELQAQEELEEYKKRRLREDMEDSQKEFWKSDRKGVADRLLGRFASRKLIVWVTATVALFYKFVPAEHWVTISLAYIGSQAVIDLATAWAQANKGRR